MLGRSASGRPLAETADTTAHNDTKTKNLHRTIVLVSCPPTGATPAYREWEAM